LLFVLITLQKCNRSITMPRRSLALTLAGSIASSGSALVPHQGYNFDAFTADFNRRYETGTTEYGRRKEIFESRLSSILAHNADSSNTWTREINDFADFTNEEFRNSGRLGLNRKLARQFAGSSAAPLADSPAAPSANVGVRALPSSWDWRDKGVISSVKDQGHCGSCWAFATTETVESHVALGSQNTLEVLSPQQLVSCAPNPLHCGGVGACEGSVPEVAYQYIQLYGMVTEWMYPYTSYFGKSDSCSFNGTKTAAVISISGYQKLPPNSYQAVLDALVHVGPLAVNVEADKWSDYHSGVFDGCSKKTDVHIDHVVQLVGYGTDPKGGDYFLIRNSWDATWGENGYIRLKRTSSPQCSDDNEPLDGTGCEGGPASQQVCGECGVLFDVSYPLGAKIVKYGHHEEVIQV